MNNIAQAPAGAHVFEHTSIIKTNMDKMIAFHEQPSALGILTPPPIFMQLKEDNRTSLTNGDLKFTMWFTLVPIQWHAQHQAGPTATSFADLMLSGPLAYWRHEHIFEAVNGGIKLTDRVTLAHKSGFQGILTRLMFDGVALRFLFVYRHLRTRLALR